MADVRHNARMGERVYALMQGEALYGHFHAVACTVFRERVLIPTRAKPTLCGLRRVCVTSNPWQPDHPMACALCSALTPEDYYS